MVLARLHPAQARSDAVTDHTGRIYRATGLMTVGTLLSRITGFVRVAAMVYALGVTGTRLADTYNLANITPNILYELFLGGIFTAVFVPAIVELRETRGRNASALVSVSLVLLAVVSAVTAVAAPLIIRIYTFRIPDPATRAAQLELASYLLRWFAPQIFFYGLSAVAQALLNVRGRFGLPAFAPALNNLAVVATFLGYATVIGEQGLDISSTAKTLLGLGTTAGVFVQAAVMLPALRVDRLRFRPHFRDPDVQRVMHRSAYVVSYVVINQIGLWVTIALANGQQGGVTAIQIAFMFFLLPHGLFAVGLITALFPDLSRAAAATDWETFRRWFATGIRGVAFLLVPAVVGYLVLAQPITRLVLARGVAEARDAALVASVLQAMATGLVFFSAFQLLTRCFYALLDTRTATVINAISVSVNIAADFPLYSWLGLRGLAFASALSYVVGAIILTVTLDRRIPGGLHLSGLIGPLSRIAGAAAVMAVVVVLLARVSPGGDLGTVAVGIGAGAILYLAFSQVVGLEERQILFRFFGRTSSRVGREGGEL